MRKLVDRVFRQRIIHQISIKLENRWFLSHSQSSSRFIHNMLNQKMGVISRNSILHAEVH